MPETTSERELEFWSASLYVSFACSAYSAARTMISLLYSLRDAAHLFKISAQCRDTSAVRNGEGTPGSSVNDAVAFARALCVALACVSWMEASGELLASSHGGRV